MKICSINFYDSYSTYKSDFWQIRLDFILRQLRRQRNSVPIALYLRQASFKDFPAALSYHSGRHSQPPQPRKIPRFWIQERIKIAPKKTSLSAENLSFLASWRLIMFCSFICTFSYSSFWSFTVLTRVALFGIDFKPLYFFNDNFLILHPQKDPEN